MRVTYKVQVYPQTRKLVELTYEYCCDNMKDLQLDDFVEVETILYGSKVATAFLIFRRDEDALSCEEPLNYCPCCGKKVLLEEMGQVVMVDRKITETSTVEKVVWEEVV